MDPDWVMIEETANITPMSVFAGSGIPQSAKSFCLTFSHCWWVQAPQVLVSTGSDKFPEAIAEAEHCFASAGRLARVINTGVANPTVARLRRLWLISAPF
jgi:hypothetical protein